MKATIAFNEKTINRLSEALDLPPIYDEKCGIDEFGLSYAIKMMVELCEACTRVIRG